MIKLSLTLSSFFFMAYGINAEAFVGAFTGNALNCSARSPQTRHYEELIHNIAIRGDDERKLESGKTSTLPLFCKSSGGKNMASGSISLVVGKRAVTVLHNLVELSTCAPLNDVSKCALYDGSFAYDLRWEKDPVEICKENGGRDQPVEGHLPGEAPKRKGYKVICKSQLGKEEGTEVVVRGAIAKNFTLLDRSKFGKAVAKGEGKIYRVSPYENTVRYDVDTGPGTSGGATTIFRDGEEYMIAIHRGDKSTMSYSTTESAEDPSLDGLPADEVANYGEGLIFPDDMKICSQK